MNIYFSLLNSPYINLAIENYFFRNPNSWPTLFLYVNEPSIIFGRFQNPWLEINLKLLRNQQYHLVRRQSGGGCVIHDFGNLNYSILTNKADYQKKVSFEVLEQTFKILNLGLKKNERHDIVWEQFKIGGSAFKDTKLSGFHHGTILINSKVEQFKELLTSDLDIFNSKSIKSVRSKVKNLTEIDSKISMNKVVTALADSFQHFYACNMEIIKIDANSEILKNKEVQDYEKHLRLKEWIFGETPIFDIKIADMVLQVKNGEIQSCDDAVLDKYLTGIKVYKENEFNKIEKLATHQYLHSRIQNAFCPF